MSAPALVCLHCDAVLRRGWEPGTGDPSSEWFAMDAPGYVNVCPGNPATKAHEPAPVHQRVTEYVRADEVKVGDDVTLGVGSQRVFLAEPVEGGRVRLALGADAPRVVGGHVVVARHRYLADVADVAAG